MFLGLEENFDITTESYEIENQDDENYFDDNGLLWHYSSFGIKNMIFSFLAMGGEIEFLDQSQQENDDFENLEYNEWLYNEPEQILINLCIENTALDENQAVFAYEIILKSFNSFDFANTLYLALHVMKFPFPFTKEQLADIHSILALTTHNRQFSSTLGNQETNIFIENHLTKAYALEEDPIKKAFIQYRMTVLKARRQKDLDQGMKWANITLEQSENQLIPIDLRHYIKAWALNIRAYIFMITRRLELAREDMIIANQSASELKGFAGTSRDYAFTISVMADNMGALTELMGNPFQVKSWLTTSYETTGWHTTNQRFGARIWTESHLKTLRIDLAIEDTLIGLDASRTEANPFYEDLYLAHLGEFYHRLGQTEDSQRYFRESLNLHQRYYSKNRYQSICMLAAKYALFSGFNMEGSELLQLMELNQSQLNEEHISELNLLKSILAALNGQGEEAIIIAQSALEESVSKGELFNMIYTITVIAGISGILGNNEDEKELYIKGRELIDLEEINTNSATSGIIVNLMLGYLQYEEHHNEIKDVLPWLIFMMPSALVRNAESWKNLHYMLQLIKEYSHQLNLDDEQSLFLIILAGSQRKDSKELSQSILRGHDEQFIERYNTFKEITDYCMKHSMGDSRVA